MKIHDYSLNEKFHIAIDVSLRHHNIPTISRASSFLGGFERENSESKEISEGKKTEKNTHKPCEFDDVKICK
jgi:hypothetical protein